MILRSGRLLLLLMKWLLGGMGKQGYCSDDCQFSHARVVPWFRLLLSLFEVQKLMVEAILSQLRLQRVTKAVYSRPAFSESLHWWRRHRRLTVAVLQLSQKSADTEY